jgi:hypothetical protein
MHEARAAAFAGRYWQRAGIALVLVVACEARQIGITWRAQQRTCAGAAAQQARWRDQALY